MRNPVPSWIRLPIPKEFDITCLRPASLPKGKRFETERDAYKRRDEYIIPGLQNRMPHIAERILECPDGGKNCLLPICPICARHYRRYFISEILRIYEESQDGAQTATVYLGKYETGSLKNVSLKTVHDRFRHQLFRCDFGGAILIGGTEVTYRHEKNDWLLHLHLLSLGVPEQAWEKLEKCMSKSRIHDPLRIEPVKDPIQQLSYLQKFCTYHRPGTHRGKNRARPVPLKNDQLCELASWACNHDFTDFTFCFGFKRLHGRFYKL